MSEALDRTRRYLEHLYETKIQRNWDRIIPVVGSEGVGKSTWILQAIWLYEQARGNDPDPATVMNAVVFDDRDAFRDKLLAADEGDPIAVMDAAHILYNRDVMMPDQKETEKSLLDIRVENYVIFLGYQDWGDIPRTLRKRRAENAFYIPRRGYVKGYNRDQLDEKHSELDDEEWPDPALEDTFPSLEGTELWNRFETVDTERKRSRLQREDDTDDDAITPQDVVDDIVSNDALDDFVDVNEFQDRAYFSKPYIRFEYPDLSDQEADQVRSALRRQADPAELVDEGETETQPPAAEG